jgi:hypothetical protein
MSCIWMINESPLTDDASIFEGRFGLGAAIRRVSHEQQLWAVRSEKSAGLNPHLRFFQRGQQFLCLTNLLLLLLFLCFGFKSCHLSFVGFDKFGDFGRAKRVS